LLIDPRVELIGDKNN